MATTIVTDRLTRGRDFKVGILAQLTKGVVNTTPAFEPFRRTSGKPKQTIGYTQDDTIQTTNQGQANIQDTNEFGMDVEASTSKQSIRLMMQALHGDETIFTVTATTIAAVATGFTVPAGTYAALSIGDGFWVTGFVNTLINGFYIVAGKTGGNTIATTIAPVATEIAGASVTLKSNKTLNADLPTYNLLQRQVVDVSAAGGISYMTLLDGVVDTHSIAIEETGIVKSSTSFKAERRVTGTAAIAGQTYAADSTDKAVSSVLNVLGFYVDGLSLTCIQKKLSIEVANGYVGDDAAGCARQFARGQFAVSGSVSFRSRISNTLDWEAIYLAGTLKSIGVRINHSATEETYIVIPQCCITEHSQADGSSDVASHEVSFGAEGSAIVNYTTAVFKNW